MQLLWTATCVLTHLSVEVLTLTFSTRDEKIRFRKPTEFWKCVSGNLSNVCKHVLLSWWGPVFKFGHQPLKCFPLVSQLTLIEATHYECRDQIEDIILFSCFISYFWILCNPSSFWTEFSSNQAKEQNRDVIAMEYWYIQTSKTVISLTGMEGWYILCTDNTLHSRQTVQADGSMAGHFFCFPTSFFFAACSRTCLEHYSAAYHA